VTLDDDQVNTLRWIVPTQRGVVLGAQSGEWLFGAASQTNMVLTPSNNMARKQGDRGSDDTVAGLRVDGAVLFVQRGGQKVREFVFDFGSDSYRSSDLTILAEHITGTGLTDADFVSSPDAVLWFVRSDGALVSLTYDREQDVRAWCVHYLGNGSGGNAFVESCAAVPSPDGTTDDLYVVCRRASGRTIEVIRSPFRADRDGVNAGFFVDCGLTYSGTPVNRVTGLSHLEGQTVSILADGATRTPQKVVSGAVSIGLPAASLIHVGLPYVSRISTLPLADTGPAGTVQGARKRPHEVRLLLHETGGVAVGQRGDTSPTTVYFRTPYDPMSQAVGLFTGTKRWVPSTNWDRFGQLSIWSVGPQPMTLQGMVVDYHVGD
jgi:hypothetical protein